MSRESVEASSVAPEAEPPQVPGISTWRGLYGIVLACFFTYVLLLVALSAWFP